MKPLFLIRFEVAGFPGVKEAGPYSAEDLSYQRRDIEGYEGVTIVETIAVTAHIVHAAQALCRFSDSHFSKWPKEHRSTAPGIANCVYCLAEHNNTKRS